MQNPRPYIPEIAKVQSMYFVFCIDRFRISDLLSLHVRIVGAYIEPDYPVETWKRRGLVERSFATLEAYFVLRSAGVGALPRKVLQPDFDTILTFDRSVTFLEGRGYSAHEIAIYISEIFPDSP